MYSLREERVHSWVTALHEDDDSNQRCYPTHTACAHAALADNEALREGKLHSLRQALDVYRARLGLHFRKGNSLFLCSYLFLAAHAGHWLSG